MAVLEALVQCFSGFFPCCLGDFWSILPRFCCIFELWLVSKDLKGFKGAFAEQSRDVYDLATLVNSSWGPEKWILDIGGNLGITAVHLHLRAPKASLLTLEPSPWNYVLLRLNLLQNFKSAESLFALHGGLSATAGALHGTHMFTNSWSRDDFQPGKSQEVAEFTAPLRTIDELHERYGFQRIQLMKLDCEGCEWQVGIKMLETCRWRFVEMLFGEFHALCPNDISGLECLPRNVSLEDARDLWRFLCEVPRFRLWGCEEPRFAVLGSDVATTLAQRLCDGRRVKRWQCGWAKELCKEQSREAPKCE